MTDPTLNDLPVDSGSDAAASSAPEPDAPVQAPTVGTGSIIGIGCLVLLVVAVLVLAAMNYLPHFPR